MSSIEQLDSDEADIDSLQETELEPEKKGNFAPVFDLESITHQLAEELRIKDQTLLVNYVRQITAILIEGGFMTSVKNADQLAYRMGRTLNVCVKAVLELIPKVRTEEVLAVLLGGGEYQGLPDGIGKITDANNLPSLVKRWQVSIYDLKLMGSKKPIQGQRKQKVIQNPDTKLDIQLTEA